MVMGMLKWTGNHIRKEDTKLVKMVWTDL